jgi:hypothetical protein
MSSTVPTSNEPPQAAPGVFPDRVPVARHLDPAAALAFRTPLHEHVLSADGKAAGVLTMLGMMFTVLARFGGPLAELIQRDGSLRYLWWALVLSFAGLSLGAVIQSFRTISPRFPKAPPSLAFFGDIARLSREEYLRRVEALSADEALQQMLSYNHTGSQICVQKTVQLRRGMRFFEGAAGCWAVLAGVLVIRTFFPW